MTRLQAAGHSFAGGRLPASAIDSGEVAPKEKHSEGERADAANHLRKSCARLRRGVNVKNEVTESRIEAEARLEARVLELEAKQAVETSQGL